MANRTEQNWLQPCTSDQNSQDKTSHFYKRLITNNKVTFFIPQLQKSYGYLKCHYIFTFTRYANHTTIQAHQYFAQAQV